MKDKKVTFKEVYKTPFHLSHTYVYSDNDTMSMVFLIEEPSFRKTIIDILNGDREATSREILFSVSEEDPCIIKYGEHKAILIRGWGRLTGTGGFNLSEEHAARVQDDFIKWIINTLNA